MVLFPRFPLFRVEVKVDPPSSVPRTFPFLCLMLPPLPDSPPFPPNLAPPSLGVGKVLKQLDNVFSPPSMKFFELARLPQSGFFFE